jgi:hypothetical protein
MQPKVEYESLGVGGIGLLSNKLMFLDSRGVFNLIENYVVQ